MHASVLGLHVQAAADATVQAMLSSTGFSSPHYTQDFSTAVFYMSITPDNTSGVKIQPYAVSGAGIKWKQHTIEAAGPTAAQIDYVRVDPSVKLLQLPEGGLAALRTCTAWHSTRETALNLQSLQDPTRG